MNLPAVAALVFGFVSVSAPAAPPRFEKVTDHFYFCRPSEESWNVGAVITDEGVLLIDPPSEADLPAMLDALRKATAKPVKWVAHTDSRRELDGSVAHFLRQGAVVIASHGLDRVAGAATKGGPIPVAPDSREAKTAEKSSSGLNEPRLSFEKQIRLFPSGVEVRIIAVQHKARTGGDVVILLPGEKVLQTGDFYLPAGFPEIDGGAGGTAGGWIDGLKQVVDTVPVLKPAIPQPRTDPLKPAPKTPAEEEKALEEAIAVVPGGGVASNLFEMKTVLESAQRLRNEIVRARGRISIDAASSLAPYRSLVNFPAFANLLADEFSGARR